MLNASVSITSIRTLILGKSFTLQWMLVEITRANKMYTCLASEKIFENVGFFLETRKILSPFKEIRKDR